MIIIVSCSFSSSHHFLFICFACTPFCPSLLWMNSLIHLHLPALGATFFFSFSLFNKSANFYWKSSKMFAIIGAEDSYDSHCEPLSVSFSFCALQEERVSWFSLWAFCNLTLNWSRQTNVTKRGCQGTQKEQSDWQNYCHVCFRLWLSIVSVCKAFCGRGVI